MPNKHASTYNISWLTRTHLYGQKATYQWWIEYCSWSVLVDSVVYFAALFPSQGAGYSRVTLNWFVFPSWYQFSSIYHHHYHQHRHHHHHHHHHHHQRYWTSSNRIWTANIHPFSSTQLVINRFITDQTFDSINQHPILLQNQPNNKHNCNFGSLTHSHTHPHTYTHNLLTDK